MSKIYGVHALMNALDAKRVKKIYLGTYIKNSNLVERIKKSKVEVELCEKEKLNELVNHSNHQGVVAEVFSYRTKSLDNLLEDVKDKETPVLCMLDNLQDPHNLGAILRSADIFKIDGIIYKSRNSVSLNDTVAKVSAGAINYVPCYEVTNLSKTIEVLKKNSFWVVGLAGEGKEEIKNIYKDRPLVIVIGSEGEGISRLVREKCDNLLKIPQFGNVPCLNASNAAAIAFYELRR